MADTLTKIILLGACILSLFASVLSFVSVADRSRQVWLNRARGVIFVTCGVLAMLLLIGRVVWIHKAWQPLTSHMDGLLLTAALFCPAVIFLQYRGRLPGLVRFAMPLLTIILFWAYCGSSFTWQPYTVDNPLMGIHLGSVYVGLAFATFAGLAGAMYLTAGRRLKHHRASAGSGGAGNEKASPIASLESIERMMIRASAVGFAMLTIALITGAVLMKAEGWQLIFSNGLATVKLWLAVTSWVIYAILMNVRFASGFRGPRAAWLSLAGLAVIIATFSLVRIVDRQADREANHEANDDHENTGTPASILETQLPDVAMEQKTQSGATWSRKTLDCEPSRQTHKREDQQCA